MKRRDVVLKKYYELLLENLKNGGIHPTHVLSPEEKKILRQYEEVLSLELD